ncbi:MAG: zinc metallopeptidase [Pseudomonadota bacterium]
MTAASHNNAAQDGAPLVEVVPLGRVSATAVSVAAANLQALFGLDAMVAPARPAPEHCLAPTRGQYDASLILLDLAQDAAPDSAQNAAGPPLRLGITALDLCLPFLTYVFGEAQLGGRAAVVSLHRLRDRDDGVRAPRALMLERLAKLALHETAHILGLPHCQAPGCLMRFSGGLPDLDRLDLALCPSCEPRLTAARQALTLARRRLSIATDGGGG